MRNHNPVIFYEHYYEILETIDVSLATEQFLHDMLPKGIEYEYEEGGPSTLSGLFDPYDPQPYETMAKRIYIESITPSRSYFLFMTALKRGIKSLDFAAIEAYEISQVFALRRQDQKLETAEDLSSITKFTNSYERFVHLVSNIDFLSNYSECVYEIVHSTNDLRIYKSHYITHLKAYLREEQDIETLYDLTNLMNYHTILIDCESEYSNTFSSEILSQVDYTVGFYIIESELFTYSLSFCGRVNDIVNVLDDYIKNKNMNEVKDEIWKWRKLVLLSDKFNLYRVTKSKEITFKQLDELLRMENGPEKFEKVDEIISLIISDVTGSITLMLGKIIGNNTLMGAVDDALEIQQMIEGERRA